MHNEIVLALARDVAAVRTYEDAVRPLTHCHFWGPAFEAVYVPLCVDAILYHLPPSGSMVDMPDTSVKN